MQKEEDRIRLDKIANTTYEISSLLKQRYSPRTFKDAPLSLLHVKKLFEAVRWLASFDNLQPWRFIYVEKGTKAFDNLLACLTSDNSVWAKNTPMLLMTVCKEKIDEEKVYFHALYDLGLCLGAMTVQAEYLGIAVHRMAHFDVQKTRKDFEIPDDFNIATVIALGYYGGHLKRLPENLQNKETRERHRMPQTEFAFENAWPN